VKLNPSIPPYDDSYYLCHNPDVAEAVRQGSWPSGHSHYAVVGHPKGRVAAPPVDEDWYRETYPVAKEEIDARKVGSATDHYHLLGKYRGYLPYAGWRRPNNPAALHSAFGGLWTDAGNALDVIAGRQDLGMITDSQADLLTAWVTDGYVILPSAIPEAVLSAAETTLNDVYSGKIRDMRFAVHGFSSNTGWIPQVLTQPAKALDFHWLSEEIRALIFADRILDFLHLIFERRVLASQTLGFWRGSAQDGHQDSAYVNYSLPIQFAASWIALEDVKEGAGELFYYRGSHKMPEFLYAADFKGAEVAKQTVPNADLSKDYPRHIELIRLQAEGLKLQKQSFLARRGDVLIWNADLAHGGSPISNSNTRKSVVTHYCPREVLPSYFERKPGHRIEDYQGKAYFSSGQYETPSMHSSIGPSRKR
jgi:hypothetical protein